MNLLTGRTAIVAGASRGLGRGVTDLGRPAVAVYAAWMGISEEEYQAQLGEPLTPQMAGAAFVQLAAGVPEADALSYRLTAGGLQPLPS